MIVAPQAFADIQDDIDDATAVTLVDFGFTDEQVKRSSTVHISVVDGEDIRYWYSGSEPTPTEGHIIPVGGERVFSGLTNIRNFMMISSDTGSTLAITLGQG